VNLWSSLKVLFPYQVEIISFDETIQLLVEAMEEQGQKVEQEKLRVIVSCYGLLGYWRKE